MKKLTLAALLAISTLGLGTSASAQSQFGVGGGFDVDLESPFAGVQFRVGSTSLPIRFNPAVDVYFLDGNDEFGSDATALQFNINALYDIGRTYSTTFVPYVGAGLGIGYYKPDEGDSETDTGLNLIFGAEFGQQRLRPYAQAQITAGGGLTGVAIAGGVLFGF